MIGEDVLGQIWSNLVEPRALQDMSPLAQVLEAVLKVPTAGLVALSGLAEPVAFFEGEELIPGASLGDVLYEEMGLDVTPGSVVLIEPEKFADADAYSGKEIGQYLGTILMDLAGHNAAVLESLSALGQVNELVAADLHNGPSAGQGMLRDGSLRAGYQYLI
jgi:hypothetical protein